MGTAYSFTLVSNGGTLPTTWACTVACGGGLTITGSGLSINASTGVITNTATLVAGTYNFTAQATDNTPTTPNVDTRALTITIVPASSSCGPPNFNCSLLSTALIAAPALPSSLLNLAADATGAVGVNLTGNVRGAGFPTSSGVGNCITRMTDKNSLGNVSLSGTPSGGDNDNDWSFDRSYTGFNNSGGQFYFISASYSLAGCLIVNNPVLGASAHISSSGGFGFSRVTGNVAYSLSNTGSKLKLMQNTLSGTSTVTNVQTNLNNFDFATCPGMPANFVSTTGGIMGIALNDSAFSILTGNSGAQGTAYWMLVYKPGQGCATYFSGPLTLAGVGYGPPAGNIWAFCSGACQQGGANQAAPLGTETTCNSATGFGIHDAQLYRDGNAVIISGPCNGTVNSLTTWVNTSTTAGQAAGSVVTCSGAGGLNCGGHDSAGYNHFFTTSSGANGIKAYTAFPAAYGATVNWLNENPFTNWEDHGSWLWNDTTDDKPRIEAIAACVTNIHYCNEVFAVKKDGTTPRFTASFNVNSTYFRAQDAIGVASQDGYCFQWSTTGNDLFGTDSAGKKRAEILAVCNLQ